MTVFGGFLWNEPQKVQTFFEDIITTLLPDQPDTSHVVSQLEVFPPNIQSVTLWLSSPFTCRAPVLAGSESIITEITGHKYFSLL